MKKKDFILLIILFLLIIIFISFLFKRKGTTDSFISICNDYEYNSLDVTKQFDNSSHVKKASICESDNYWQIEFYVFGTTNDSKTMYDKHFDNNKNFKNNSVLFNKKNIFNFSYYSIETNSQFYYSSRIGNTLLYVHAPREYKDEVIKYIHKFGY